MNGEIMNIPDLQYLLSSSFRVSLITLVNNVLGIYGLGFLLNRRKKYTVMIILTLFKNFGYNVFIANILAFFYPDAPWRTTFSGIILSILYVAYLLTACWTYDEEPLKVLSGLILIEISVGFFSVGISAVMNYIEGRGNVWVYWDNFMVLDILNVALVSILYLLLIRILSPYIKRLMMFLVQYRKILWTITLFFVINGFISWIDNTYYRITVFFWILSLSLMTAGLVYMVKLYMNQIKQKKEFLTVQNSMMEMHYGILLKQIIRIERSRELMTKQMEEIVALESPEQKKEKIVSYTAQLKEVYEKIRAGIYCDDWLIDAIFSQWVQNFSKNGVTLEISTQGYKRGKIEESDLAQMIILLLGYCEEQMSNPDQNAGAVSKSEIAPGGEIESEIEPKIGFSRTVHLELAMMKKQLIIKYSYPYAFENKKLKRKLRKNLKDYLRKYDGNCSENSGEFYEKQIAIMVISLSVA